MNPLEIYLEFLCYTKAITENDAEFTYRISDMVRCKKLGKIGGGSIFISRQYNISLREMYQSMKNVFGAKLEQEAEDFVHRIRNGIVYF